MIAAEEHQRGAFKAVQSKTEQEVLSNAEDKALTDWQLGQIYESHGHLKEAEAAYLRVLRSGSPALREKALGAVEQLVRRQDSLWWNVKVWLRSFWAITGVVVVLFMGLFGLFGRRLGRNKLEVIPLVDTTQTKLGSAFGEIIAATLDRMNYHFALRGPIRGRETLPVIIASQGGEVADLAAGMAELVRPAWLGKLLAWLVRRVGEPEYSIRGALESNGLQVNFTVRLRRRGRTLELWDRSFHAGDLLEGERDLAYEMLIYLKEYRAHEDAA